MEDNFICVKEELKDLKNKRTTNTKEIVKHALLSIAGLACFASSLTFIPRGSLGALFLPGIGLTASSISLFVSAVKARVGMKEQIEQKEKELEHEELIRGKLR